MSWLESERRNLVALISHAAAYGDQPDAWRIALELRGFLRLHRYVADWATLTNAGLTIASRLGDDRACAALHHSLGHATWSEGNYGKVPRVAAGAR